MSEEEKVILPDGFKRVEYLEKPEGLFAYINTEEILNETSIVECTHQRVTSTSNAIYGTRKGGYINEFIFWAGCTTIRYGSDSRTTGYDCVLTANYNIINSRHGKELYINDEFIISAKDLTSTFETSGPLYLFATYNNSSVDSYAGSCRIYSLKIYTNDILVKYFIPCIDNDDIPCMYDLVSQKPFYNQGSGTFLTPKDYEWDYPLINNNYNLPAGFKKCVYLQSNGTQWIDTGHIPTDETGIFCKTIKLDNSNTSMFGVRENASSAIMTPFVSGKTISYRWKAEGKDNIYTLDKAGDYIFSSFLNFYNDRLAKIDSEDTDWITNLSGTLENYTQSIWLFSTNFKGSFNGTYGKYVGRIYRAQITQGDTLIHDYVPCLDANGRPCMYDIIGGGTVEDNTYYNQSGGTEFSYCVEHQLPSDFVKLKYLEASGTQYIKTGYVPTNNTGLYIDAYCVIDRGTNGVQSSVLMSMRQTNGNTYFSAPRLGKTSSYQTGYGWNSFTSVGGYGDSRYEGYLNWLNNKKYNVKSSLYVEKVGNLSNLSFTPTFDLCMFGNHNYDGKYVGSGYRIYRAKISEGSEIVRDFVPAFDEFKLKPCMYDLINNVAYYNDGEGEFLTSRDFEGTYKGFSGLGCISNRLGASEFEWKIPYGYRKVAYLESNGNQWIDTEIIVTTTDIDFEIKFMNNDTSKFRLLQSGNFTYVLNWIGIPINDTQTSSGTLNVPQPHVIHKASFRKNEFILDNMQQTIPSDGGLRELNTSYGYTTKLFSFVNPTAEQNYKSQWFSGRVYSCELALDGILLRNFIPCLDPNNKPCMFDIITQRPFYNQGTGEDFTYGII